MHIKIIICHAIILLLGGGGNRLAKALDWWQSGNFYQIYPRSFKDSNGDGIGDLNGITSKLEYLKELGITGTWLSPIFSSPMVDFGYDISDYENIHWEYGTLEDFDRLVEKCRELDIKLILDFVPNHTSDDHAWFQASIKKDALYKDFYIWHPGFFDANNVRRPPNNWLSVFRGSAWEFNTERGEYYLHQFAVRQPDLNYRNPNVVEAMKNVLRLWLARGVSGFRIDAVPYLFEIPADENGNYMDEPLSNACEDTMGTCYLEHKYTQNLDETFDMAYQWRAVMDEYKRQFGGHTRILMTEAYTSLLNTIRFYTNGQVQGSHIPFNFELINYLNVNSTAVDFKYRIDSWLSVMPVGTDYQSNWVMGNHDNKRLASRFRIERADLMNMLLQTLPGVAVTYNGEELALTDVSLTYEQMVDPQACNDPDNYEAVSRDPARTPFQWDDTISAGFSTNVNTWLPVANNYKTVNVKAEKLAPFSHLKIFKQLTEIRKTKTFLEGDLELNTLSTNILAYKRQLSGSDTYVVILNTGKDTQVVDLKRAFPTLSSNLEVITSSLQSNYVPGDLVGAATVQAYGEVGTILVAI